jgi:hypothetical protein
MMGKKVFVCFFLFMLLASLVCLIGSVNAQSGYTSAFEGPKAEFYGVSWNRGNSLEKWSRTDLHSGTSSSQFDAVLNFDADAASSGKPNIMGSMTTVYIPNNTIGGILAGWVPDSWLNQHNYITNPRAVYNWTIGGRTYQMQQYLLRYYVSLSAEGSGGAGLLSGSGEYPPQNQYQNGDNSYDNLAVWLKFDLEPTWYIQGQGTAYFAIGKVQLANSVDLAGHNTDGSEANPRSSVSVYPSSDSQAVFLTYEPFGTTSQAHESYYYQGKQLNPSYFTDSVYMKIDLSHFGLYGDWNTPGNPLSGVWCRGDVATFCFDITVFVIGDWSVQDIQDDPDNFGNFVRADSSGTWLSWLTSPEVFPFVIIAVIALIILFFAPWIFVILIQAFK